MQSRQILIVEDNESTRFLLEISLERAGYETWSAADGEEALLTVQRRGAPHLVLLDINMPDISGLEVGRRLRLLEPELPIVFLTAVDQEHVVLEALENYGDDYIVKPYVLSELLARMQRVLGRVSSFSYHGNAVTKIDDSLAVDLEQQQAFIEGQEISLTRTETQLLELLVSNQGRVVPTNLLLEKVWPDGGADENRLYVTVYRLRRKLNGQNEAWDYINSHAGLGYVLQGKLVASEV